MKLRISDPSSPGDFQWIADTERANGLLEIIFRDGTRGKTSVGTKADELFWLMDSFRVSEVDIVD